MADNDLQTIIGIVQTTGKVRDDQRAGEDFYDAGFSSINALQLLLELEAAFDVTIPDDEFVDGADVHARSKRSFRVSRREPDDTPHQHQAGRPGQRHGSGRDHQAGRVSVGRSSEPGVRRFRRHTRMRRAFRTGGRADAADSGAREARAGESPAPRTEGGVQQSRCGDSSTVPSRTSFPGCTFLDWARRLSTESRSGCSGTSIERSRRSGRRGRPSPC